MIISPWRRRLATTAGAALVLTLTVPGCSQTREAVAPPEGRLLVVGSSDAPESSLIAEMFAQVLENGGYAVERTFAIGPREVYMQDFVDGAIDVVPEYVSSLAGYLDDQASVWTVGEPETGSDLQATLAKTREFLAGDAYNAVLTAPAPASAAPGFVVTAAFAAEKGVSTVSDLAKYQGTVRLGGPDGCERMDACAKGLEETYNLQLASVTDLDSGGPQTVAALAAGTVDVGLMWSTDPAVAANGLVLLDDDKDLQAAENITALLPHEVAEPNVVTRIGQVLADLTTAELAALNGQMESGQAFPLVAQNWLVAKQIIPVPATPGPVVSPTPSGGSGGSSSPGGAGWTAPKNRGEPSANALAQNWAALADCESGGNPTIVSSSGTYHGLYQFSKSTWQAQGGKSVASNAPADEQTYRAQILYDAAGSSPWPHCGKYL